MIEADTLFIERLRHMAEHQRLLGHDRTAQDIDDAAEALASLTLRAEQAEAERVPAVPRSAHWLGDRPTADASRHVVDRKGCVLFFESEEQCCDFLAWLTQVSPPSTQTSAL